MSIRSRFDEKIHKDEANGCWLWTAARNENGYPLLWAGGKMIRAHRFSYEVHVGSIPAGLDLDHLCRVRHCVNPAHLEPVTRSENLRRSPLIAEAARQRELRRPGWMAHIGRIGGSRPSRKDSRTS